MKFPLLELEDGRFIFESAAIASHIARLGNGIFGNNQIQAAQVE